LRWTALTIQIGYAACTRVNNVDFVNFCKG
jgi:hypothetical protein